MALLLPALALFILNSTSLALQAVTPVSSPPASPAPGAAREQTITVEGSRRSIRAGIDRISYNVGNDLQGSSGTLADVLRNVPSVEVDPLGNVSLRGDSNVVILIDGQPAGSLRGADRGTVLQSMSANRFERVEVMTNPSAAYGPEGSGGVINLISKHSRAAGLSASARAYAGARGRVNGGVNASYGLGATTLSGDLNARRDKLTGTVDRHRRRIDPESGLAVESTQDGHTVTETRTFSWRAGIEQSIGESLRLSLEASGNDVRIDGRGDDSYVFEPGAGALSEERTRRVNVDHRLDGLDLRSRITRSLGGDHRLTADLSWQSLDSDRAIDALTDAAGGAQFSERLRFQIKQRPLTLKTEYHRPLGDAAKLQLGFEIDRQANDYRYLGDFDFAPGLHSAIDFDNRFQHRQTVTSLYATLERSLGALDLLAGLRAEHVDLRLNQLSDGTNHDRRYSRIYPTVHLSRDIGGGSAIKASFSRRVQRPSGPDLNPFREYRDPFNLRAGNPGLKPQVTDAAELAWQRRAGPTFYQATLFFRRTRNAFTDVVELLEDGVLLSTRENLGRSRNVGLELVANRTLSKGVTVNASATLAHLAIQYPGLEGPDGRRQSWQASGRASVNWQISDRDSLQLSGFLSGRTLRPQGYRAASGSINAGYRRKLSDTFSAIVTVRDLLGSFGETVVYDAPGLQDRARRHFGGRVIFVGLTATLGGKRSRSDSGFDYEAGRTE